MQSIQECSPPRHLVDEGEGDREEDDLRTRLHAMETKAKRLRNQRNSFSEDARSAAEQRDAIQNQAKEIRESINSMMEEQKKIRERAKVHRTRRDDIQTRIRELIGRSKGRREDNKNSRSVVVQLAETESEIGNIEDRIMTDGTLGLDKENKLLKKLKTLRLRRKELLPSVEEHSMIKLDLKNLDGSILTLKAEADAEHQAMVDAHEEADNIWEEIRPMFEERDFLRSEGDRFHALFVSNRKSADEVHANLVELYSEVDEIKNELKSQADEQKRFIDEYNSAAKEKLTTPEDSEELANSLAEELMASGSITLGGTGVEQSSAKDESKITRKSTRRNIQARRGR